MNKLYLINCNIPFYFLWHSGLKVNLVKKKNVNRKDSIKNKINLLIHATNEIISILLGKVCLKLRFDGY